MISQLLPHETTGATCFENYVCRLFLDHYSLDDIKFWRTQKGQEVAFVIAEKNAYEIKYSLSGYDASKYQYFKEKYPGMSLTPVHKENIIELSISMSCK
ncbi:MAG: DUF4143 domain-containing protein [Candidatus Marinimicrobia bacterium]|nr:DUF4143 domain-containing protein [Candidatus Neomarinimicrobiota bacterium]